MTPRSSRRPISFRCSNTRVALDLSLAQLPFEERAANGAEQKLIEHTRVTVTPLTALLIYKMVASRPKDLDDVRALLATRATFNAAEVSETLEEIDAMLDTNRAREFKELLAGTSHPSARRT